MLRKSEGSTRSIWILVLLVGGYIALQMIADVAAVKIVELPWLGLALPGGTLVFALTFSWRDALHRVLGQEWAKVSIFMAALFNILLVGYLMLVGVMPYPAWWGGQDAYNLLLMLTPRIAVASVAAELVSELLDTYVFEKLWYTVRSYHGDRLDIPARYKIRSRLPGWLVVILSNTAASPIDSVVFTTLAFAGTMPFPALLSVIWGSMAFKWVVGVASAPLVYVGGGYED